jgi:hypothetical protein
MSPKETNKTLNETATAYSTATPPTQQLIDSLYREEILQARQMAPDKKLLAGERLFEWACEIAMAGIREQFPGYSEEQCRAALAKRLALKRKLEEHS